MRDAEPNQRFTAVGATSLSYDGGLSTYDRFVLLKTQK